MEHRFILIQHLVDPSGHLVGKLVIVLDVVAAHINPHAAEVGGLIVVRGRASARQCRLHLRERHPGEKVGAEAQPTEKSHI